MSEFDKDRGLYHKFHVTRADGQSEKGRKHENCDYFVLDLNCDPYALPAMIAYYEACKETHPALAKDIKKHFKYTEFFMALDREAGASGGSE